MFEENKEVKETSSKKDLTPKDLVIKVSLTKDEKENKQESLGRQTSYTVKATELNFIHVELENVKYNGPKKVSVPFVQMYESNIWHSVIRNQILNSGYSHVRILHSPKGSNVELKNK